MDIKTIVKDTYSRFHRYRAGIMYYRVTIFSEQHPGDQIFEFPVPLEDIGDATLEAEYKTITLMRYVRKAQEDGTFVKVS